MGPLSLIRHAAARAGAWGETPAEEEEQAQQAILDRMTGTAQPATPEKE